MYFAINVLVYVDELSTITMKLKISKVCWAFIDINLAQALSLLITLTVALADPSCFRSGYSVTCSGSADHILRRGLVSDSNTTTTINLRNCHITDIHFESFENLFVLQSLDLSHNKIQRLKLGVLDGFRSLKNLNLSYNSLTKFPLGLFDEKPNLRRLDLKGNQLEELELGIFDPLKKLRHLDLSRNVILGKNLNPYIFDCCPQIQFIDFSHNDMSDTPDIMLHAYRSIDFLNLHSCSLDIVPHFATGPNLKTMKHLMLSSNKIKKLNDSTIFSHLENLEKLNLALNIIEEIHEDIFKPLKKVQLIFLFRNRITGIPETLFRNLHHLNNIDLSNNLIEYVPVNAFRGTNLKQLNLSGNSFTYLQYNFCFELRNSGAKLQKFFFSNNPWQCACLNDVLVEVKKYGIEYQTDIYRGKRPVCVTKEFRCNRQPPRNKYFIYSNTTNERHFSVDSVPMSMDSLYVCLAVL